MYGQNREQLRRFYQTAWRKHLDGQPLEPLERLVAQVITQHPEYHDQVLDPQACERDFPVHGGQTNPFLHMGMHITLAEQLASDRPAGIRELYRRLVSLDGDTHRAEHRMMECLGEILWEAQRTNRPPDEQAYLACLRRLLGQHP
ncbi:DUF1841 family protein [endosymbiont of unidentified scaly snail isolate Monju]|uniref:DUF1841 family protein n=1 Tax=endosymbiont of unidentified scaly snail isolate Monju TaxID=1248727 RepID=UPI0003892507|nr:DUF1841 family protein [endosymbiont of unidentified scaly snail isolate Monju]BAN68454.1 conserved hypothetical protein [endosymbiont of unidentified scaly snail isolate Monju]